MAKKDNEDCCPICLDASREIPWTTTECNHRFHKKCLDEIPERGRKCPLCRSDIEPQAEIPKKDAVFFRLLSVANTRGRQGIYSFGTPSDFQPTDSVNFSRMETATLRYIVNDDSSMLYDDAAHFNAARYNTAILHSGHMGLRFDS